MVRSWLAALPRLLAVGLLAWVDDNPLRVSALVAALASGGVLVRVLREAARAAGTTVGELPPSLALHAVLGHPAYLIALAVGVGAFVAWR